MSENDSLPPTKRVGRPPLYKNDAERRAARKKYEVGRRKNVSLDADLITALNEAGDRLAEELGFRPTHSQTIHYLINKFVTKR